MAKIEQVKKALQEAQKTLTMKDADFSCGYLSGGDAPLPKTEAEVTEFIRNRTRLWRQTWIEAPINEALRLLGDQQLTSEGRG